MGEKCQSAFGQSAEQINPEFLFLLIKKGNGIGERNNCVSREIEMLYMYRVTQFPLAS